MGYKVDIAENGLEGIEKYKAGKYDLILMDVQMPKMGGFEATKNIKELTSEYYDVPIIAMTAHAMKGFKETCLEAGMDDYISKPFKPEILQSLIRLYVKNVQKCEKEQVQSEDASITETTSMNYDDFIENFGSEELMLELFDIFVDGWNEKKRILISP